MAVRPVLTGVVVSKHFLRDVEDRKAAESIVGDILDCSSVDFVELHKFEIDVDGNMIFRAKKERVHIVYCVDKRLRIIFLRAFKNYSAYARFLGDKKEIRRIINSL
jgi:hypothetical protein